ncbi:MAG TPA: hypothetical protein VMM35_00620 [Longimicrobiales bacterium]|nr:hypothetical protein [Longimicrobiales bacterium]
MGAVEVTVATTGASPDPDGYEVTIDEATSLSVPVNGSVTFTGVQPGGQQVTLMGQAANCAVGPSNPQSVTVVSGQTVTVFFQVDCP